MIYPIHQLIFFFCIPVLMKVVWAFIILIQQQHLKLCKLIHKYKTFLYACMNFCNCIILWYFALFHLKSLIWSKLCQNSPFLKDDTSLSYIYFAFILLYMHLSNKQLQKLLSYLYFLSFSSSFPPLILGQHLHRSHKKARLQHLH